MNTTALAKDWEKFKEYRSMKFQTNLFSKELQNIDKQLVFYLSSGVGLYSPASILMKERTNLLQRGVYPETIEGMLDWINAGKPMVKKLKVKLEK